MGISNNNKNEPTSDHLLYLARCINTITILELKKQKPDRQRQPEIMINVIKSDNDKTVEELLVELEQEKKNNIFLRQQRQQEKLSSVVLDHMVQMVILLDAQGRCMEANKIAIITAGSTRDRIQGMHLW